MPLFATYIQDLKQLKCALELNYDKLLIEEPRLSLLCTRDWKDEIDYNYLEKILSYGKNSNKSLQIIFNLDIIAHQEDLLVIKPFLNKIKNMGYDGIRVQDLGIASLIKNEFPEFRLEINTYTGNDNWKSLEFLEKSLSPTLKTFVFSKEVPIDDLIDMNHRSSLENEILIHGPILLFYTKRRLIEQSDFIQEDHRGEKYYKLLLEEQKRPGEYFPFHDNPHGSFLIYPKELCLFPHLKKVLEIGLNYVLFDFRNKPLDVMKIITEHYHKYIDSIISSSEKEFDVPKALKEMESYYSQGFTEGFFLENKTDSHVNQNITERDHCLGEVIGTIKESVMAVEVMNSFNIRDELIIHTPEGKEILMNNYNLKDFNQCDIEQAHEGDMVIMNWRKGVTAKSLIFRK